MSMETMRIWAESAIQSALHTSYSSVPIKFDNAPFLQPDTTWVAFCVLDGKSFALNLGTVKVDRHVGLLQADVMVPQNTGTSEGNTLAEFIGKLFREQRIGLSDGASIIFQVPDYMHLGVQGGFYRIMCRVPFWRDEPPQ